MMKQLKLFKISPTLIKNIFLILLGLAINVSYADVDDLSSVATNISDFIGDFAKLMTAMCFAIGFGFGVGAIIKYKAHRDNPQYITLSIPVTLLIVCIIFLFLGVLLVVAGQSIFGPGFKVGL